MTADISAFARALSARASYDTARSLQMSVLSPGSVSAIENITKSFMTAAWMSEMAGVTKSISAAAMKASGMTAVGDSFATMAMKASGMTGVGEAFAAIGASVQTEIAKSFAQPVWTGQMEQIARSFATPSFAGQMQQIAKSFATPAWTDVATEVFEGFSSGGLGELEPADFGLGALTEGELGTEAQPGVGQDEVALFEDAFGPSSQLTETEKAFVWWYAAVLCWSIATYYYVVFPEVMGYMNDAAWVLGLGFALKKVVRRRLERGGA
jgi:hypothetical protein